jgi:hypothetical protein
MDDDLESSDDELHVDSDDDCAHEVLLDQSVLDDHADIHDDGDDLEKSVQAMSLTDLVELAKKYSVLTKGCRSVLIGRILRERARMWQMHDVHADVKRFDGPMGPIVPSHWSRERCVSPSSVFWRLFTDRLAESIVEQTNLYAKVQSSIRRRKRGRPSMSPDSDHSSTPAWRHGGELTVAELRLFLGLVLHMGIKRLPEIRDHWSTDEQLCDHYISSRMSHLNAPECDGCL